MIDLTTNRALLDLIASVATVWQTRCFHITKHQGRWDRSRQAEGRLALCWLLEHRTQMSLGEIRELFNLTIYSYYNLRSKAKDRYRRSRRFRLLIEAAETYWTTGSKPMPHEAAMLTDEAWAAMRKYEEVSV